MTPRGRKPLPTSVKRPRGTLRAHRMNPNEPDVPPAVPDPPAWLQGEALAEWKRITPRRAAAGLLTQFDLAVLAGYCGARGDLCDASRTLAVQGSFYVNDRGAIVANPLLRVVERSRKTRRAFASEFGLSPSARARAGATPTTAEGDANARRFFPLVNRGGRA